MKRSSFIGLFFLSSVAGCVLFLGMSASAHCGKNCTFEATHYPTRWKSGHHTGLNVTYRMTSSVPPAWFRDRITEAMSTWTAMSPSMGFEKLAEVSTFTRNCPNSSYHGIFYEGISDPDVWARANQCEHTGTDTLHEFHIMFDSSDRSWYTGTTTSIPTGEVDLKGTATHEAGHATGFHGPHSSGHFDPTATICDWYSSTRQTMCPTSSKSNSWWWRSPESHDTHTFEDAYIPAP